VGREVPPVGYFDASTLYQPRLTFHRCTSARADRPTFLLPSLLVMDTQAYPGKDLPLPQLLFALNAELQNITYSPS
jgi:hypothetical protein